MIGSQHHQTELFGLLTLCCPARGAGCPIVFMHACSMSATRQRRQDLSESLIVFTRPARRSASIIAPDCRNWRMPLPRHQKATSVDAMLLTVQKPSFAVKPQLEPMSVSTGSMPTIRRRRSPASWRASLCRTHVGRRQPARKRDCRDPSSRVEIDRYRFDLQDRTAPRRGYPQPLPRTVSFAVDDGIVYSMMTRWLCRRT